MENISNQSITIEVSHFFVDIPKEKRANTHEFPNGTILPT